MKIQLVVPEQDLGRSFNSGMYYPFGLLSIATYLTLAGIEVEIIDGGLDGNTKERIIHGRAGLVGISCNSFNYKSGLDIAMFSKSLGKIVVMGGPHASYFSDLILRKRSFVDYIVKGEGEKALLELIQGKSLEDIQNMVYRKNGKIFFNTENQIYLYQQIALNYNLLELDTYWNVHKQFCPFLPREVMLYFSHVGCRWREKTGGCVFCALRDPKQRYQNPQKIWKDFRIMREEYGMKAIKDYGDDITGSKEWVKTFLEQRPKDMADIQLLVYGSARFIDDEMADLLQKLNVSYVFVGFESGNDSILKKLNKGTTRKQNLETAQRLINRGIGIFASYIFGGPDETEETMLDTKNLASAIADYGAGKGPSGRNLVELSNASPFVPMPGSRSYQQLYEKNEGDDIFDCESSIKSWITSYCHFKTLPEESYQNILQLCNEVAALSPQKNYLGWENERR